MKTAILTDTNSGIYPEEAARMGIFVLPMPILIDEQVYYEGKDLTEESFYSMLSDGRHVTTSQPSPGDVMDQWDALLRAGYEQIVYIPMSSGLSNSCQTAVGLADDYEGQVFVADNHRISVTLRESVAAAKRMADEGAGGAEIKTRLEADAYRATIYISVNTLEYLKRGGRITSAAAMIGTALGIKPILTIQGEKLDSFSKERSMKKCEAKMIEAVRSDLRKRFPDAAMQSVHVGAAGTLLTKETVEGWLNALRGAFPGADVYYNPLSLSIGCHIGPGAVAVGVSIESSTASAYGHFSRY